MSSSFRTLAEILAAGGYLTAGVSANSAMVVPDFGLAQGFQFFKSHHMLAGKPYLRRAIDNLFEYWGPRALQRQYIGADDVNRDVVRILDQQAQPGRPFFLFVNYMDAHGPWVVPREFVDRFSRDRPRIPAGRVV
jgi:hypothetical protein